jgi:cellobiose dehydrogenase (acceptor)
MGEFQIQVKSATQASYAAWVTKTAAGPTVTASATVSAIISSVAVPTGVTYDYVVVGAGAGGIPMADRLSEAGHSVLLIEKGIASSARWGGTIRPETGWLDGYNLTWFDIPGECNGIWNGGSVGVACTDTDQMAGCVLGGGTAVNAGLWWKPNPSDWEDGRHGERNQQSTLSHPRNRSFFYGRQTMSPRRFQCDHGWFNDVELDICNSK